MSLQIKKMKTQDLPQVTELAAQLGYPNSLQELEKRFAKIEAHPDYALFVAKSENDKVLGWVQVHIEPFSLLAGEKAEVGALIVDEKHRGQKIGQALLKRAEEWAHEKNLSLVRLRSNTKRTDAHRFYQREGYTLAKTACIFTKEIELANYEGN